MAKYRLIKTKVNSPCTSTKHFYINTCFHLYILGWPYPKFTLVHQNSVKKRLPFCFFFTLLKFSSQSERSGFTCKKTTFFTSEATSTPPSPIFVTVMITIIKPVMREESKGMSKHIKE